MNIKFGVENFRVFDKMSYFDIKPITIITGKNSSGKSSLLKAIQVLANSISHGNFFSLRLWDNDLNLGSFDTLVSDSTNDKINFTINNLKISYYKCKHYPEEAVFNDLKIFDDSGNEVFCFDGIGAIREEHRGFWFSAFIEEHIVRESKSSDAKKIAEFLLSEKSALMSKICYPTPNVNIAHVLKSIRNVNFEHEYDWDKKITNYISKNELIGKLDFLDVQFTEQQKKEFCVEYENSLLVCLDIANKSTNIFDNVSQTILLPSSRGLNKRIYSEQNSDNFLEKALFDSLKHRSENYKDGKFFMGSGNIRFKVEDEKVNYLTKWFQEFGLGQFIEINHIPGAGLQAQVVDNDKKTHLADLGFGYSQLLPIILLSSYEDDYKNLIIEEPESHLHPNLQSKLAEMFVDAYQIYKSSFIIETHSEYLIRKLQYLVAKGKISKDDIAIYYFDKTENKFEYRKIEMRSDGILKEDFGAGFFDESVTLTKELLTRLKNN